MNYAEIYMLHLYVEICIEMASVPRNIDSFLAQSSILSVEILVKTSYLNFEGDSACNLVNLLLGTYTKIRINIPFQKKAQSG